VDITFDTSSSPKIGKKYIFLLSRLCIDDGTSKFAKEKTDQTGYGNGISD
jgi:hypothetical protein